MNKIKTVLLLLVLVGSTATAQNLNTLFANVDTIWPGGALGRLTSPNTNVTPIVSSSPCNNANLFHYAMATQHQSGKVIAVAHEGIFVNNNITQVNNLTFLTNAFDWLNPTISSKRVTIKNGWVSAGNTSTLQNALISDNYTITSTNATITSASLANTDILLLGNDWNGQQAYLPSELAAIDTFVTNGGGLMIAGLGWSWPLNLSLYPMNQTANLFGIEFTRDIINDPQYVINNYPQLYNFYPDNLDTTSTLYCPSPFVGTNLTRGADLRVLKLAVSVNGEFTQQNGGVAATTTIMNNWLDEINDMYGREFCVRFEIIPTNSQLIFSDPNTDPWGTLPQGSGGCTNASIILNQQAAVIDGIIGAANYDISHVIAGSPFGGGCAGSFKSGLSGGFDIPVTRHEMGHQFSQSHTINHGDRNNYEPENGGWSMQGGNGHGYAHAVSFHQLANNLLTTNANAGTKIPTNNNLPTVDAGADVYIPISTPFTLTGTATDADANDTLTYVWDNMDRGIPQTIPIADDLQGALFMRLLPTTAPSRTFPTMADVVANNNSNGQEQLPTQPRVMPIRLTVNDNHKMMYNGNMINASGISSDDIILTVANAGPFVVTSQNVSGITYNGGTLQTVTWDVNGTDIAPINTQNVKISLSTDGGFTYPTTLLGSTPNSGSASVTIPNINATTARIKVEAVGNIYFDINTQDFEIKKDSTISTYKPLNFHPKIYPNPAKDFITIEVDRSIKYVVRLYDATGRLLVSESNIQQIDIAKFPSGMYSVEVLNLKSKESVMEKVVIVQ